MDATASRPFARVCFSSPRLPFSPGAVFGHTPSAGIGSADRASSGRRIGSASAAKRRVRSMENSCRGRGVLGFSLGSAARSNVKRRGLPRCNRGVTFALTFAHTGHAMLPLPSRRQFIASTSAAGVALAATSPTAQAADEPVTLVKAGKPVATIVVEGKPPVPKGKKEPAASAATEYGAAILLAEWLKKITDAAIPIAEKAPEQ